MPIDAGRGRFARGEAVWGGAVSHVERWFGAGSFRARRGGPVFLVPEALSVCLERLPCTRTVDFALAVLTLQLRC